MFPLRLSGYFFFDFPFSTSSFLIPFSGLSFSLFLAYFLYLFFLFGFSYPFSYLFFLSVILIYFSYLFSFIRSSSPILFSNPLSHPSILLFYSSLLFYYAILPCCPLYYTIPLLTNSHILCSHFIISGFKKNFKYLLTKLTKWFILISVTITIIDLVK